MNEDPATEPKIGWWAAAQVVIGIAFIAVAAFDQNWVGWARVLCGLFGLGLAGRAVYALAMRSR